LGSTNPKTQRYRWWWPVLESALVLIRAPVTTSQIAPTIPPTAQHHSEKAAGGPARRDQGAARASRRRTAATTSPSLKQSELDSLERRWGGPSRPPHRFFASLFLLPTVPSSIEETSGTVEPATQSRLIPGLALSAPLLTNRGRASVALFSAGPRTIARLRSAWVLENRPVKAAHCS